MATKHLPNFFLTFNTLTYVMVVNASYKFGGQSYQKFSDENKFRLENFSIKRLIRQIGIVEAIFN